MKKPILILLSIIALISCKKENDESSLKIENYPMSVGTEWTYESQVISKYYESETSENIIDIDTVKLSTQIWIEKDTILNDTMNVKIFKTGTDGGAFTEFKYMDNEGLKTYAHIVGEIGMVTSLNENLKSCLGQILVENKPLLDIQLPLKRNSEWIYSPYISKKVIGKENIKVEDQDFSCYKVEWTYDENLDYGVIITEWISEKGLIKKQTVHDKAVGTIDPFDPESKHIIFQNTIIETLTELKIE